MPDRGIFLAILGMTLATMLCRLGGYWVFRQIRPTPALRTALGYIPGALFVSYVVPALAAGGVLQWIGAAATIALMLVVKDLSLSILGGTAVVWMLWALG